MPAFNQQRSLAQTFFVALTLCFALAATSPAQNAGRAENPNPATAPAVAAAAANPPAAAPVINLPISVGDDVEVTVFGAPDMSAHQEVDGAGNLNLALVNSVHVAGLTSDAAAAVIEKKLRDGGYMNDPHVNVFVKQYSAAGISILGEVLHPGVYPAGGERRLWDVILSAGGLTERAGDRALIQHPHSDETLTATLSTDPQQALKENVEIQPGDTVVVERAAIIYVIGEVTHAAAYPLADKMTVLQALARADGPTADAALNRATVLRKTPDGVKKIRVNVQNILQAKETDPTLEQGDILFVPGRKGRYAAATGIQTIFSVAAGLALHSF